MLTMHVDGGVHPLAVSAVFPVMWVENETRRALDGVGRSGQLHEVGVAGMFNVFDRPQVKELMLIFISCM